MKTGLSLVILSRQLATRNELTEALDPLRAEFVDLDILNYDMTYLTTFNGDAELVVVDLENWLPSDELVLNDLRELGYQGPVIVLTKRLGEAASADYLQEKIIFYDRTKSSSELIGIARRMMMGSLIAARKHPRHATSESAQVQMAGKKEMYPAKVVNLSKGGALLKFERAALLKIGDTVTLKIKLSQLNRIYSVRGRVAWVKLPEFGIEFTDEES